MVSKMLNIFASPFNVIFQLYVGFYLVAKIISHALLVLISYIYEHFLNTKVVGNFIVKFWSKIFAQTRLLPKHDGFMTTILKPFNQILKCLLCFDCVEKQKSQLKISLQKDVCVLGWFVLRTHPWPPTGVHCTLTT